MSLTLTRAAGIVLYQDLGRPGYAELGISPSGAANRRALIAANAAVGNAAGAPALEIIGPCDLHADRDVLLSVSGANVELTGGRTVGSSGTPVRTTFLRADETLEIRPRGIRTYLAVRGGFDPRRTLGSASHDTLSGLGPPPLAAGEVLPIGSDLARLQTIDPDASPPPVITPSGALLVASVYPGPRSDWVLDLDELFDREYRISELSDRIGVRLNGARLARSRSEELPSEGIVRGAIQLPPSGEPLIFGPDHPTTGGYPVIGVLAPVAADALAHAVPGQAIRFRRARPRTSRPH